MICRAGTHDLRRERLPASLRTSLLPPFAFFCSFRLSIPQNHRQTDSSRRCAAGFAAATRALGHWSLMIEGGNQRSFKRRDVAWERISVEALERLRARTSSAGVLLDASTLLPPPARAHPTESASMLIRVRSSLCGLCGPLWPRRMDSRFRGNDKRDCLL